MKRLLLAIQFLTIMPVRVRGQVSEHEMLGSALFFPMAGLMQGVFLMAAAYGMSYIFGSALMAAMLVFLLVLTNGGFHLDGLADTMDGLASKGEIKSRLDVMHDGATGPVGTSAIVFALLIKSAALYEIGSIGMAPLGLALLFTPAISKWVMLLGMRVGAPARSDGLGRIFIGRLGAAGVVANALLLVLLMVGYVMLAGWSCEPPWHAFPLLALLAAMAFTILFNRVLLGALGGQTGDTLGATGEITEVLILLMAGAWSNLFIS